MSVTAPETMTAPGTMTVGEVARISRVSVRTLHHYDAIGLLAPTARSESGYRLYTDADLARLQLVLFYRELGLQLDAIRRIVHDQAFDRREALSAHRNELRRRMERLHAMVDSIDRTLAHDGGIIPMAREEMFEVFGDFDPSTYEEEVRARWADTDAYRESARRSASYTKDDWQRYAREQEALDLRVAELMDDGVPADEVRAMDAAEELRLAIDRWFYPCSRDMHARLGEMYVADERFTATYEAIRPGMAAYLRDATAANARR
jgi:MerR family transcriptional regulator, thiopeptide resistance regulator